MKKLLISDKMLRLISFIVAVLIWLYINIVINPSIEVTVRDLPIQFVGTEKLNDNGLGIVTESATTVTLKIKGNRKTMGKNNMDTIIAKADVSNVYNTGTVSVPVEVVIPFENSGISNQSVYAVDISVEKIKSKTLNLEINTEGSLADGYMAGPIDINPSSVTISGPESVIGKIVKAGVTLDYGNADVDIDAEVPIRLYGADGKEFSIMDAILTRINRDNTGCKVHCAVVKLKEVDIHPIFDDDELIKRDQIIYSIYPSEVQIYGETALTAKISSISTEIISTEKLRENKKVKVKLNIPEGVKVLQDIGEVEITLKDVQGQN